MATNALTAAGVGTTAKKSGKKAAAVKKTSGEQLAAMKRRLGLDKLRLKEGAAVALNVGEIQGTVLLASAARGYLGADKFQLLGQDLALLTGLGGTGFGLMEAFRGKKYAGHVLAVSNGLLAVGLVGVGEKLGEKIRTEGLGSAFGGLLGGSEPRAPMIPAREAFMTQPQMAGMPPVHQGAFVRPRGR